MPRNFPHLSWTGGVMLAIALAGVNSLAEDKPADAAAAEKAALAKVQALVGQWKGVGQPQRGSTKESWIEQADWSWKFEKGKASLVGTAPKSKYFQRFELKAEKDDAFALHASPAAGGEPVVYKGTVDADGRLALSAEAPRDGLPGRITFRFVAENNRLLTLYEGKGPLGNQLVRLAEVGATRQGSDFGKGSQGPECVVTGGLGTMAIAYNGKTYYVCCTGCRDYFNENPEKAIAEYHERKAEEKKAKEAKKS